MTQGELADALAQDYDLLTELIERFYSEDVKAEYDVLMDSIADRFASVELHQHEKTFRPVVGIGTTYGSEDPGAALARMQGRAKKLKAIIGGLRRNPTVRLKTKPRVVSHDPEDIAAELEPFAAQLHELARNRDVQEDDYKSVLRSAAGRLSESSLDDEAKQFTPPLVGRESLETLDVIIGRHANALDKLVKTLKKDRAYWMRRVKGGSGPAAPQPARGEAYVSQETIDELERLKPLLGGIWDVSALIALCEGINSSYAEGNHLFVSMGLRSTMNHVPPLFGQPNFESVIAQAKPSLKKILTRLYRAKDISDYLLHWQIQAHIVMPDENVVDHKTDFNFLIARVIELLQAAVPPA